MNVIVIHRPWPADLPQLDAIGIIHQYFIVTMNVRVEIDP